MHIALLGKRCEETDTEMVDSWLRGLGITSSSTATLASHGHRGDDQRTSIIQVEEGHQVMGNWVAAGYLDTEHHYI